MRRVEIDSGSGFCGGVIRAIGRAEKFLEGGALFYVDRVSAAESMSSSDTVWGMLPMPKADRESDYSGYIAPDATVLCVPVCNSDDRLSGDFIEAFFACSTGYIKYDHIYHGQLP